MSLTSVPLQYSALTGPLGFSLEWYYFGRCMHFRHSPVHSHGALATKSIVASNLQVSSTNCTVFPHSAVMRMVHEHNHRHPELVTVGALNSLTNGSWKEPMKSCLDTFPPQLVRSCYWFPLQEYKGNAVTALGPAIRLVHLLYLWLPTTLQHWVDIAVR